jgi:TonB family protein
MKMPETIYLLLLKTTEGGLSGWTAVLASHALKGLIIFAAATVANTLLRGASASARHLIWAAAFTAVLLIPATERVVPAWAFEPGEVVQFGNSDAQQSGPVATVTTAGNGVWPLWILFAWAAGALFVIGRFASGLWRVSRITDSAEPLNGQTVCRIRQHAGIRDGIRVLRSPRVSMPMTWGALHPVILLPESASSWPEDRLRMVLFHEFVHVARHDWLVHAISQLTCSLHWFNPLVWFGASRLTEERERACDDGVLRLGEKGGDYAGHLLELVKSLNGNYGVSEGVAMAQSHLEGRIRAMLNPRLRRGEPGRAGFTLTSIAMLLLLVPLASLRAPAQSGTNLLTGTVRDASGGVVPEAAVLAINVDTGKRELINTSQAGDYSFKGLPAGTYTVQVRKPGFALLEHPAVAVPAGAEVRLDFVLNIGKINETVKVTAPRPAGAQRTQTGAPTRIRVGGHVQAAKLISKVNPIYPATLKQQGIEGTVLLRTVISTGGVPLEIELLNTSAHPEFVAASTDAIRQWRYEPTLLNGNPVEVITEVTVNFTLSE